MDRWRARSIGSVTRSMGGVENFTFACSTNASADCSVEIRYGRVKRSLLYVMHADIAHPSSLQSILNA
jgi:hypothetical protein